MSWRHGFVILLIVFSGSAPCQQADGDPGADSDALLDNLFRDISDVLMPPPAVTIRDMQHLATAMQLRDYCMNPSIPNPFVRDQLKRFSSMTGRVENCRTLLDY